MKTKSILLALLLLASTSAFAQTEVEIGYRFLELRGNEGVYRSQINEREGLILRAFTMTSANEGGLIERFRITGTDLGAGPFSTFRIEASKDSAYRFTLGYRSAEA